MRGDVTDAGRPNNEQLKIELLSQWMLEAESRNSVFSYLPSSYIFLAVPNVVLGRGGNTVGGWG